MRTLLHKRALITGGGSGIGLAIARRLYLEGCSVTLLGRTESTLRQAQSLILSSHGSQPSQPSQPSKTTTTTTQQPEDENDKRHGVSYHPLNVTSAESWERLLKSCGRVDILINCAGITQRSPLMKTAVEEVDELVGTNLTGTVLGCKFVGRVMLRNRSRSTPWSAKGKAKGEGNGMGTEGGKEGIKEGVKDGARGRGEVTEVQKVQEGVQEGVAERGVIVNVASLLAQKGVVGTSVYAAAKAGVVGLTTSLANEYGRSGIRVNAVLPGYIETDMTTGLKNPSILQQIPLGRFGTTDEVADAALFLIKNPYANNCVLNLDGGLSAV